MPFSHTPDTGSLSPFPPPFPSRHGEVKDVVKLFLNPLNHVASVYFQFQT